MAAQDPSKVLVPVRVRSLAYSQTQRRLRRTGLSAGGSGNQSGLGTVTQPVEWRSEKAQVEGSSPSGTTVEKSRLAPIPEAMSGFSSF